MIPEPSVEYFYGETMRWSFGFDNPNKAAVIFACLLPLLFQSWMAGWRFRNIWLRGLACLLTGGAFLLAGYCLCMTFSRGALVAAVMGLGYVAGIPFIRERGKPVRQWIAHGLLLGVFGFLVVWTGLGARTGEATAGDRSVGNRIDVWSAALQMSVENPRGFGADRSGLEYMEWYQATDREEGYRTMVNSYLTFLVERGWGWFAVTVIAFSCFWAWTASGNGNGFVTGLRGLLIAFLVAGIFSTTMEEWRLWMLPGLAMLALLVMKLSGERGFRKEPLAVALGVAAACVLALLGKGWVESSKDPLQREFGQTTDGRSVIRISKKGGEGDVIGVIPDSQVLGDFHGKLLRELAEKGDATVVLGADSVLCGRVMLMGSAVNTKLPKQVKELFLLSPEIADESVLSRIKASAENVHVLLGEIDEDGRVAYWEETGYAEGWEIFVLQGVGIRADWAWEEVTELLGAPGG